MNILHLTDGVNSVKYYIRIPLSEAFDEVTKSVFIEAIRLHRKLEARYYENNRIKRCDFYDEDKNIEAYMLIEPKRK